MWSIIAGAAVAVVLAGIGVWNWRISRQIIDLRRDVADAVEVEQVVRRSKRRHLRRVKSLVPFVAFGAAGRQVRDHPVIAATASTATATAMVVSFAVLDGDPRVGGKETAPNPIEVIDPPERRGGQRPDRGGSEEAETETRQEQPAVPDEVVLGAPEDDETMAPTEPEPAGDPEVPDELQPELRPDDIQPDEVSPDAPTTTVPAEPVSEPVDNDDPDETMDCLTDRALGGGDVAELDLCLNPPGKR